MYISYKWLKDFVKLPTKIPIDLIASELTDHTVEVEGFVNQAEQFNKVVVGKVLEIRQHPNADRLRLAVVDVKKEKLNIVCGAPNLAEGQLVPVALIGALLPNGLEIKESEIRGEKSSGMICAEDELGIGKNHEGIVVLKSDAKIGESFSKYLKLSDTIFEIDNKSLSNRPDLLSHYGIAREIGVIFDLPLKPYEKLLDKKISFLNDKQNKFEVKIEAKEECLRYIAVKIEGIEVKDSPEWLKERLIAVNQKPINNIVDLTNYVMLDCGQPLHAFNAEKIKKIVVRSAQKNENFETLDEKERILVDGDLLITDGNQVIALAGIMGGKNSGITNETKEIILESANFKARSIRKTSQRLGLRTEASARFEKSLDPNLCETAVFRFLTILKEICPSAQISSSLIDINQTKEKVNIIILKLDWLTKKIGQEISKEWTIKTLESLGFGVDEEKSGELSVIIPSWRATKDISIQEDLVEEILRIYGYNKIVSQLPLETLSLPEVNHERQIERKIKDILALKHGLSEVYNYSFLGEDQLKKLSTDSSNYLRLANPLSDIQTILRQTLAPGLINNIKNNQYKADSLGFFEIGSVFFSMLGTIKKEANGDGTIPYQEKHIGLVIAGDEKELFARLKGIVNNLFQILINYNVEIDYLEPEGVPGWADRNRSAVINVYGKEMGILAVVNQEVASNYNLKKETAIAEINFNYLLDLILNITSNSFQEAGKYPSVSRDLAFVLNGKILYNEFKSEISKFNFLIKNVELFDVYTGENISEEEKSLAFHLTFQSDEKTLTTSEIDLLVSSLLKYLETKYGAKLRS